MMRSKSAFLRVAAVAALTPLAWPQAPNLVSVVSKRPSQTIDLPGEFMPFLHVSLHARVSGYVDQVLVDVGSLVKEGDVLAKLTAPEMDARISEAQAKVQSIDSDRIQAEAQLAAAQVTSERLKKAAETPGAIAANELIQAEKQVDALQALVRSRQQMKAAAQAAVKAQEEMQSYLTVTAPFDGVVTERLVHPGALVGPGPDPVLLVLQQVSRLRLVVPVPEESVAGLVTGATVSFSVPAYPERTFSGKVARIPHVLDEKTRSMPVEIDVSNPDGSLAPGMYPDVKWPVRRVRPALFVPTTSVVTTTERRFVIREQEGRAEWVDVRTGITDGDLVEVTGDLKPGDKVVRRGTDEIQPGTSLSD